VSALATATRLLLPLCLLAPSPAAADRIFYRGEVWLETSAGVQRLSLLSVLRGWERVAESAGAGTLSLRQREAVRLHRCLSARPVEELLERVTSFGLAGPERVHYSLSDFIRGAEGSLRPPVTGGCAARREDGISTIRIRYAALALDFTWYNFVRIHRSEVDALTEVHAGHRSVLVSNEDPT